LSIRRIGRQALSRIGSIFKRTDLDWNKLNLDNLSIYIYKTDCLYLCTYLYPSFTGEPPDQSSPNFAQTSAPTQGWFLAQAWPRQPDPRTPGYPKLIKFFPGSAGARLASIYKRLFVPLHLCPSFTIELLDQLPPNFALTSKPNQESFLTQVWPRQPDPWPQGTPTSKT